MFEYPIFLKRKNPTSRIFHNGKGQNYIFGSDAIYGVGPDGEVLYHIKIEKNQVVVLQESTFDDNLDITTDMSAKKLSEESNKKLFGLSNEQKDKGLGIQHEEEKARRVLSNGDCSDGAPVNFDAIAKQRQQEQSALQDSG